MNTKFYIITLIISLLLMMPSCFISDCGWVNLLSSIGCSGFAAAVMAIFLEKNMEKRKERFKETYFLSLIHISLGNAHVRPDGDFQRHSRLKLRLSILHSVYRSDKGFMIGCFFRGVGGISVTVMSGTLLAKWSSAHRKFNGHSCRSCSCASGAPA